MLMTNEIRIKTEVKAPTGPAPASSEGPDIVCRNVNLAYGDNHVLHDITMDMEDRRVNSTPAFVAN